MRKTLLLVIILIIAFTAMSYAQGGGMINLNYVLPFNSADSNHVKPNSISGGDIVNPLRYTGDTYLVGNVELTGNFVTSGDNTQQGRIGLHAATPTALIHAAPANTDSSYILLNLVKSGNRKAYIDSTGYMKLDGGLEIAGNFVTGGDNSIVGRLYADTLSSNTGSLTLADSTYIIGHVEIAGNVQVTGDNTMTVNQVSADSSFVVSYGTPWDMVDGQYKGTTVYGLAHETLAFGDVCFMNSDGEYAKAAAGAAATMPGLVMALGAITNDTYGLFLQVGYVCKSSWTTVQTKGAMVYVDDDTAGLPTTTIPPDAGDVDQIIGYCIGTDIMFFNPQYVTIER